MINQFSISLLPEFGWSVKGTPVYGPGSVFQGFIKLNIASTELKAERIRLAFYGTECIPPFELSPGVLRTKRETLFSIQQVIWSSKDASSSSLAIDTDYTFPFTIQMPMVQFPPTMQTSFYEAKYQLIALIDTPSSIAKKSTPFRTEISVTSMPYVETSMLKAPFMLQSQKGHLSCNLNMKALEFVPGESIPIALHVVSKKPASSSLQYITAHLRLDCIISNQVFDDLHDQVQTIANTSHKLLLLEATTGSYCHADLELKLPIDITPSCDYGNMVRVSYKLHVNIDQKGPMGGIWSYSVNMDELDITIGTLGYGIKSSSELALYSSFDAGKTSASERPIMPLPKFMKTIEYEDALPLYDASKLPEYDWSAAITEPLTGC